MFVPTCSVPNHFPIMHMARAGLGVGSFQIFAAQVEEQLHLMTVLNLKPVQRATAVIVMDRSQPSVWRCRFSFCVCFH